MEGEIPTEEAVPEFCFFSSKTALQLVSRGARKKVELIIRPFSEANSDPGELRRYLMVADDCKQMLYDIRYESS